jgi:hypothetical protein
MDGEAGAEDWDFEGTEFVVVGVQFVGVVGVGFD